MDGDGPTPPPLGGEISLRVRYNECDPQGVAHHSSYVSWLEMGRTELLRDGGMTYAQMEDAGVYLVVARLDLRYRSSARYDDEVVVVTEVTGGGRARIDHRYEVWKTEGGRGKVVLLCEAVSTLACVDGSGRPLALPGWLKPERTGRAR